jgi:hypothetical protein
MTHKEWENPTIPIAMNKNPGKPDGIPGLAKQ